MTETVKKAALALAALMLTGTIFAACGETASPAGPSDTTAAQQAEAETTAAETQRTSGLPDTNWEGRTITFLARGPEYSAWESIDVYTDKENGETLNDALYRRNLNVEEKYNVKIAESKQGELNAVLSKAVQAGDSTYDAAVLRGVDGCTLSQSLLLVDLHTLPNLDLSNEWWDQNAAKDFSIGSRLYIAVGDFLISDKDGSWIYTFNKEMADDFGIEYPYEMAKNGTWTYDRFYDMAKQVGSDLNGDGQMTGDADRFGIATERYDTYAAFFYSGGRVFSNKNNLGYPEYTINDEYSVNAYDKYYTIVSDTGTYFKGETGGIADFTVFSEGRALFRGTTLNNIRFKYRDLEFDFGLVVAPKYNEAQENYGHVVSIGTSASVICVPQTSADLAFTGFMLEAVCFESTDTLLDAYVNVAFNSKYIRDEESIEMLRLNFASRVYDFSIIYTSWGSVFSTLFAVNANTAPNIASMYASTQTAVETQIQKTFASFTES